MPVLFDVEVQDESATETVAFLTLGDDPSSSPFIERAFVEEAIALRDTDVEAYGLVWETLGLLLERGAPMDALDG
jgi:hypothetical protein